MDSFIYFLDYFGTASFALAGVLAAQHRRLDLFGVLIMGIATAVGGGTLRDLILNRPVFWLISNEYIWISLTTSMMVFLLASRIKFPSYAIQVADAIGLSVFTIIGCKIALELNHSVLICVMTGIMTGVFGGILRDVLTAVKPMIFQREIYATAVMLGAIIYVNLSWLFPQNNTLNTLIAMIAVLTLRISAIHWKLHLPIFLTLENGMEKS